MLPSHCPALTGKKLAGLQVPTASLGNLPQHLDRDFMPAQLTRTGAELMILDQSVNQLPNFNAASFLLNVTMMWRVSYVARQRLPS